MSTAYPLEWPRGWPKTEGYREASQFKCTLSSALQDLKKECRLMEARDLVLSSNYTLGNENPKEPGVVAYFTLKGNHIAIPCDRWSKIEHNVLAIAKTINALRGMERWGAKHMISAMFSGFKALPQKASGENPLEVLGLNPNRAYTKEQILAAYRQRALTEHPDKPGGSNEKWLRLREAYEVANNSAPK